jgi:hypothetical protein
MFPVGFFRLYFALIVTEKTLFDQSFSVFNETQRFNFSEDGKAGAAAGFQGDAC